MCHRQYADDVVALLNLLADNRHGKVVVAPQCAVGYHYTLREARCAACVVDKSQFFRAFFAVIVYMFFAEILRILLAEHLVEVFACVCQLVRA